MDVPTENAAFEEVFYTAPDGLRLHACDYGRNNSETQKRLPLICLPGLTRNTADFHDLALLLSTDSVNPRRVVSFDYRGRGKSQWAREASDYTVLTEAEDILAGLAALGIGHGIFLGTSRGGLIMHVLAVTRPAAISAAILNDIGPVIGGDGLAQIKAYLTRAPKPKSWQEAAAIQAEVHGKAFPALSKQDWPDFARAIYVEHNGAIVPNYDPKLINDLKNMDFSTPLPTLWPQFEALAADKPLLVLRGENSALLSDETAAEMKERAPHAELITVPGQGHAPILHIGELPVQIAAFLARCDSRLHH